MPLEIRFGIDASRLKAGEKVEIVWRENEIVNPHVLIHIVTHIFFTAADKLIYRQKLPIAGNFLPLWPVIMLGICI